MTEQRADYNPGAAVARVTCPKGHQYETPKGAVQKGSLWMSCPSCNAEERLMLPLGEAARLCGVEYPRLLAACRAGNVPGAGRLDPASGREDWLVPRDVAGRIRHVTDKATVLYREQAEGGPDDGR